MKVTLWIKSIFLFFVLLLVLYVCRLPLVWQWIYPVYYPEIIKENAVQFKHNPNLILAIIQTESKFSHDKTSKKGAIGLMQIMSETADWIMEKGKFPNRYQNNVYLPEVNVELGSWYLRYLLELYDGNMITALAAYNAGPGAVNRWLATNEWDGSYAQLKRVPYGETRHYVQRVLYIFDRYERLYSDAYWFIRN